MRGCLVTATDTGVGKTVVAAALIATLQAHGQIVRALKPVITGLDDPPDPVWPPDHVLLASLTGQPPEQVSPVGFGPAVSPHLAAELTGTTLDRDAVIALVRDAIVAAGRDHADALIVEGVGGLLVPFAGAYSVRDLARELRLPVVLVARPGLGTINHTLLTLEAARAADLSVACVVLNPWPAQPDAIERSNRATIASLGHVGVSTIAAVERPEPDQLVAAASELPVDGLLGRFETIA